MSQARQQIARVTRRVVFGVLIPLVLVLGFIPFGIAQQKSVKRDWQKYPAIAEAKTTHDIYAIGDVHGDYDRFVAVLSAGKIIPQAPESPEKVQWNAGKAILVCTGDMIDKGDQSMKVIALFRALQTAAAGQGGRVICCMGNHEAEFLMDPTNKKAKQFVKELRGKKIDPADVAQGRDADGIGAFLSTLPLGARVNDWFFAHAGMTRGRTLAQLEMEVRDDVNARGYDTQLAPSVNGLLEARLYDGPWWEVAGDTPAASKARLRDYVQALGANHLVVGHYPSKLKFSDQTMRNKGEIHQFSDGLLFLIDVGMSRGVDKTGQGFSEGALLHIQANSATAIFPRNPPRQMWLAKPK